MQTQIEQFFTSAAYGVAGASTNRDKFGNKVLRCYIQHSRTVCPINPRAEMIEGLACVDSIADLPDTVKSLSIITPPTITEKLVLEAAAKGIKNIWMQPGAESQQAIAECHKHGINVITGGPCILVELGFKDN